MRLETLSKELVQYMSSSANPQKIVENLFWKCIDQIDNDIFDLIGDDDITTQIKKHIIPTSNNFITLVEDLDQKYFEAEDNKLIDLSFQYFRLARLMASLDYLQKPDDSSNLYEAAYEALMSIQDPDTVLIQMLSE